MGGYGPVRIEEVMKRLKAERLEALARVGLAPPFRLAAVLATIEELGFGVAELSSKAEFPTVPHLVVHVARVAERRPPAHRPPRAGQYYGSDPGEAAAFALADALTDRRRG